MQVVDLRAVGDKLSSVCIAGGGAIIVESGQEGESVLVAGGDDNALDVPQGDSIAKGHGAENGRPLSGSHGLFRSRGKGVEG